MWQNSIQNDTTLMAIVLRFDTINCYNKDKLSVSKGELIMQNITSVRQRRKKKHSMTLALRRLLILIVCIALFFAGRMSARTLTAAVEPVSTIESDKPAREWNLILVNAGNPLHSDVAPALTQLSNGQAVDSRIYPELQRMMDDARAQGLSPLICSSYRTEEKQTQLYQDKVRRCRQEGYSEAEAKTEAARWVAPPGTSEHQTGLAVDIVAQSHQLLDSSQENTPEQKWLMENCAKYGFVLRYPTDKGQITGIGYEPWHYRYVGKQAAVEMKEKDLCLEEYLQRKKD